MHSFDPHDWSAAANDQVRYPTGTSSALQVPWAGCVSQFNLFALAA